MIVLVDVILYVTVQLKKNPELVSPENIVKLVSSNPIIAVFEFVVLYLLKGIRLKNTTLSHKKGRTNTRYSTN